MTTRGLTRRETLAGIGAAAALGAAARPTRARAATTTIRYWTWQNSADTKNPRALAQAKNLEAFRKAHPDIEVIEEVIPWQNLHQQLLQASAAGKAPDVCRQLDRYIPMLAEAEAILPLDEFVKDWSAERRNDYVYAWDDTTVGNQKFAFRHAIRPLNLMYYRTDLFREAGFPEPPKTLEELTAVAKATTKGQVIGFALPFSKADGLSKFLHQAPPMYWSLGSDLIDLATGKATFHLEAGQKIFQWIQDMVHVHRVMPIGSASIDSETQNQMFIAGALAMNFDHSSKWAEWSRKEALQGRIETAWTPSFSDEPKPVPANTAGGWTLVMPRGAKKEAAWKLISFLQSNEAELTDARVGGELPTRKSTLADPFFKTEAAARMVGWLDYMAKNPHPATILKVKKVEVLATVLADAGQAIIVNKADVKSTLAAAAQRYDAQAG